MHIASEMLGNRTRREEKWGHRTRARISLPHPHLSERGRKRNVLYLVELVGGGASVPELRSE
jgi:hypothetical protein